MTGRSKSQSRSRGQSQRRSQQRTQRRSQRGGAWGAYPDSAWGFQMNNLGSGWNQFRNVFLPSSGENLGAIQSNAIVQNNAGSSMTGGKKHRHRRHKMRQMQQQQMQMQQQQMQQLKSQSRGKKGGYWGAVLEQAAVPLALLGMQQAFGKSRKGSYHKKTFKRRR